MSLEIHNRFPIFYSFLSKSGTFTFPLMTIVYNRNISRYPRVRSSCFCFRKRFHLISSVLPERWITISGARLRAMSHIGVLAAPQASTSPNKICQADKKLISLLHSFSRHNSSPGCGRNAELGPELVSAQVRNELAAWKVNVHPSWPGTPQQFASRSLLRELLGGGISPAVHSLIQRCP